MAVVDNGWNYSFNNDVSVYKTVLLVDSSFTTQVNDEHCYILMKTGCFCDDLS